MGFFDKIKQGLRKTREGIFGQIDSLFKRFQKVDEELFEELEELLIMADCGANTALEICDQLRKRVKKSGTTDPAEVKDMLEEVIGDMLEGDHSLKMTTKPSVILVIGVNGVGKTTTIGKLCARFKAEGKKTVIAAADTFRAAAIDQLAIWAERSDCDIVKHSEGADPAAVVFDAAAATVARGADILIIDTAGRLHNKKYLMDELGKISRVLDRELGECDREVLLVLDATTGQNAVNQARAFRDTAGLTGIVLTKLDGTARGGVVISIKQELGVPVKFIGVGEQIDDLQVFEPRPFARALFDGSEGAPEVLIDEIMAENEAGKEAEAAESAAEETAAEEAAAEETFEEEEAAEEVQQPEEEPAEDEVAVEEEEAEEEAVFGEEPAVEAEDICEEPADEEYEEPAEEEAEEAVEDEAEYTEANDEEAFEEEDPENDDSDIDAEEEYEEEYEDEADDEAEEDSEDEPEEEPEEKTQRKSVWSWIKGIGKKK